MPARSNPHPSGPSEVSFLVSVEAGQEIEEVAERLRGRGLHVERVRPITGIVVGSGPRSLIDKLRLIEGVRFVREEGGFQLPPFDPSVPQ